VLPIIHCFFLPRPLLFLSILMAVSRTMQLRFSWIPDQVSKLLFLKYAGFHLGRSRGMLHSLQSVHQGVCSFLRSTSDVHTDPHTRWPLPAVHHNPRFSSNPFAYIDTAATIHCLFRQLIHLRVLWRHPVVHPPRMVCHPRSQASAGAPTDSPDPAIDPQSNAKLILVLGSSGSGLSSFVNRVAGSN
jgi:hypothetical protein